jgi:hypothetical protein
MMDQWCVYVEQTNQVGTSDQAGVKQTLATTRSSTPLAAARARRQAKPAWRWRRPEGPDPGACFGGVVGLLWDDEGEGCSSGGRWTR